MKNQTYTTCRKLVALFCIFMGTSLLAQAPSAPQTSATNKTNGCASSITLGVYSVNAPSGLTHKWYTSSSGSQTAQHTIINTGGSSTYVTELVVTQTVSYWVSAVHNGQESSRTMVTATYTTPITTPPSLTLGYSGPQCGPSATFNIGAGGGGSGSTYQWYGTSNTTGTPLHSGTAYNPTLNYSETSSGNKTYWVKATLTTTNCYVGTVTETKTITVSFKAPVPTPTSPDREDCGPTNFTLTASGAPAGASYRWYNPSGTVAQTSTSNSFSTGTITSTRTYQVSIIADGCEGTKKSVLTTIKTIPNAPTGNGNSRCGPGEMVLTASGSPSAEYRWYNPSGALISGATTSTLNIPLLNLTATYQVSAYVNGCESTKSSVIGTINPLPNAPTTPNNFSRCGTGTITITASGFSNGQYRWYNPSGNILPGETSASLTIANLTTTATYQVSGVVGCESAKTNVTATINPPIGQPTVQGGHSCGPSIFTLTAGGSNSQYRWYNADGSPISGNMTNTLVTLELSETRTYKVSIYEGPNCEGPTRDVTATITQIPAAPTVQNNGGHCGPGQVQLTASGSPSGTYRWYNSSGALIPGNNTGTLNTGTIEVSASYEVSSYITTIVDGTTYTCEGPRSQVVASINIPKIYYLDQDNDGLGDPTSPSSPSCTPIAGYVDNSDDLCPEVYSPINDCNFPTDPDDQNYVYSRTYQTASSSVIDPQFFTQNDNLIQQITYFDGLGRPMQQNAIAHSPSPSKGDIITHIGYDGFGRNDKDWLPVPGLSGGPGSYRTLDLQQATKDYYKNHNVYGTDFPNLLAADANPFSEKLFEASPLNRVLQQAAPGEDWKQGNGHEIDFVYGTNTLNPTNPDNDNVRLFSVDLAFANNTYTPTLLGGTDSLYEAGELYKNITKDENHPGTATKLHTTEEFSDKQGRVVLKRTYALVDAAEEVHDTYYVYDDFGNLSYVLPPLMNASTTGLTDLRNQLAALGYRYVYDHRNRLVEKQIPGKLQEYIIYNKLDQPIMTQDANQRLTNQWLFTKYDAFGRVAYTGKSTDTHARHEIQDDVNNLTGDLWVSPSTTANPIGGVNVFYNNNGYPTSSGTTTLTEILTINYYDNYDFLDIEPNMALPAAVFGKSIENYNNTNKIKIKGLQTGSKIKVLEQAVWITSVTGYDDKGLAIYTKSKNDYLETMDSSETLLDFVGKPLKTKTTHTRNAVTITTLANYTYDHVGRLLSQTQCIGDGTMGENCPTSGTIVENLSVTGTISSLTEASNSITATEATILPGGHLRISNGGEQELIVYNDYDALGQLVHKKVGGSAGSLIDYATTLALQTMNYEYNVRGWLKAINNPASLGGALFGFGIKYNDIADPSKKLYNGNISHTLWNSQSPVTGINPISSVYTYTYDALNRITGALDNTGHYNLGGHDVSGNLTDPITYDKNGNILSLERQGHTNLGATTFGLMDDLTYTYNGNQLKAVDDDVAASAAQGFKDGAELETEYRYDDNGNMVMDLNKYIGGPVTSGILYNHLNLPVQISINGGGNNGTISYIYDATGTKMRKITTNNLENSVTTTDYTGNFIYENSVLQFFRQPEGYTMPKDVEDYSAGFDYVYEYKDHLGNTRLSYTDADGNGTIDPANEIVKESNYYPFGLSHKGYNGNVSPYGNSVAKKYMFGGKEYQDELDLAWYDVTARNYDPALGRWMNLDPLAEQMRRHSPYNYAFDNPIFFIDYDGMAPCPPGVDCSSKWEVFKMEFTETVKSMGNNIKHALNDLKEALGGPIDVEGDPKRTSDDGGTDFYSKKGNGEGDSTDGTVDEFVNGDAIIDATSAIGSQKTGNKYKSVTDGMKLGKDIGSGFKKGAKAAESTMNEISANKDEPDAATMTATRETNIATTINSPTKVTASGGTIDVVVKVATSQIDSVNKASAKAIQNAERKMEEITSRKLDSLKQIYNN